MVEIALIAGVVLVAAFGLFRSFQRGLTHNKKTCSCGQGCSCGDSSCPGHDLFAGPHRYVGEFDEAERDAHSGGKVRQGHF